MRALDPNELEEKFFQATTGPGTSKGFTAKEEKLPEKGFAENELERYYHLSSGEEVPIEQNPPTMQKIVQMAQEIQGQNGQTGVNGENPAGDGVPGQNNPDLTENGTNLPKNAENSVENGDFSQNPGKNNAFSAANPADFGQNRQNSAENFQNMAENTQNIAQNGQNMAENNQNSVQNTQNDGLFDTNSAFVTQNSDFSGKNDRNLAKNSQNSVENSQNSAGFSQNTANFTQNGQNTADFTQNTQNQANYGQDSQNPANPAQPPVQFAQNAFEANTIQNAGVFGAAAGNQAQLKEKRRKQRPRKVFLGAVLGLIGVALVATLVFVLVNFFTRIGVVTGSRTVMVFMLGGDLESEEAMASADLEEMRNVGLGSGTQVVVYTGGASAWSNSQVENGKIYEVGNGSLSAKATLSVANMASADALEGFLEYVVNHYNSDLYDLIIWGRSGGPAEGLGTDETALTSTALTLADIKSALSAQHFDTSRHLEMIGFDAPLMASMETAVALAPYADYLVASEDTEPAEGWNYGYLGWVDKGTASRDLVTLIVEKYAEGFAESDFAEQFWSLSAVDLALIAKVTEVADPLFANFANELSWDNFSDFTARVTQSTVFGYDGAESADLVDFSALLLAIAGSDLAEETEATEAESLLAKTIVANKANVSAANGLSTFYISHHKPAANASVTKAKAVSWADGYTDFLTALSTFVAGNSQVAESSFIGENAGVKDGAFSLTLPDDLNANYERAKIYLWEKEKSNRYVKVFESTDITKKGATLSTADINSRLVVSDSMSSGYVDATEIRRDTGSVYYAVPVTLTATNSGLATRDATAIFKSTEGSTALRLVDLRLPGVDGLLAKGGMALSGWSTLNFSVDAYQVLEDAGDLATPLATPVAWGTASSTGIHLNEITDLSGFLSLQEEEGTYYAQFVVFDTQGNTHYSQLMELSAAQTTVGLAQNGAGDSPLAGF